jgi:pimeloyl-ACP methyl ester carboxylesterase
MSDCTAGFRIENMWLTHLALTLAALYIAIVTGMYFAQTSLLFPTTLAEVARIQLPGSAQRLEVRTPDGEVLVGVQIPATREPTDERTPKLLGFGGNAWNAEAMALYLHELYPNREVTAFHYRGYAPSSGRPSAEALLLDSVVIFDHLQQAPARQPITMVGFSVGSGVAAYLARHRPAAGLILVTPFDSLEALAYDHYWWAPVGLLLRHRMPTIDFVRGSPVPTAIIIAERDTIVPARRSTALRPAIENLVFEATVDAGHNDLYGSPAFAAAMGKALARIEAAAAHFSRR